MPKNTQKTTFLINLTKKQGKNEIKGCKQCNVSKELAISAYNAESIEKNKIKKYVYI